MRTLSLVLASVALTGVVSIARATTFQELTMDEMIQKSTGIVRAKVTRSHAELRGRDIYTYYELQVVENLKAASPKRIEVAVPGGTAAGLRQRVIGAPELNAGVEYVIFLWTSRSGLTQIIGLSQGLFTVTKNADGSTVLARPAVTEPMVDKSGHTVNDHAVTMSLNELRSRIQPLKARGKNTQ